MIPRHWPDRLRRRVEKHLALRHGGQCRHACFLSPLSSISLITSLRCGVDTSKRPRLRSPKPNGPGGLGAAGASGLTEAVADWLRIAITPPNSEAHTGPGIAWLRPDSWHRWAPEVRVSKRPPRQHYTK